MVDLFQRSEMALDYAKQAADINAKTLWLQLGVINEEAKTLAELNGMSCVMDRCVKIEHARLFGGLNFIGVNTKVITSSRSKTIAN